MNRFQHDDLFDSVQEVVDFRFDERVTAVFPDMIHRSVPGYATMLQLVAVVGSQFVREGGLVYDLGCSLGAASIALSRYLPNHARICAVDLSPSMVQRFRAWVEGSGCSSIEVCQGDILSFALQACDVVVMNLTMQFLPPEQRDTLLARIYQALRPGGALILSEKTKPSEDNLRIWHEHFKRSQGYSEMAIAQKRESLEQVMKTDRAEVIVQRLQQAGFAKIEQIFQALQFMSWVAIK